MAASVVLVLVLFAPAFSFPFAIPEYTPEIQIEQETPVTNNVPQIQSGIQEKTGVPVSSGCSAGYPVAVNQDISQPVTKVQDAPVNVEQAQAPNTEPLFLPPQPVPAGQADQIVRPVIVPAEAIASGRVIIMAVEPIQQRSFPDVIIVPQQQPVVSETPVQQSVEKQTPYQENYSPVQPNSNAQETLQPNFNEVPQRQSQVQPENSQQQGDLQRQAVEKEINQPGVQVQPPQWHSSTVEHVEKQAEAGVDYTPVVQTVEPVQQVQTAETVQQGHNVQPWIEKQLHENPQQVQPAPQQQVYTAQTVPENIQKQVECAVAQSQSELQKRVNVQETGEKVQQWVGETYQQQAYSVQPEQVVQAVQSTEPQQEVQQQIPQVQHPVTKTENQQAHDVLQQVNTFAANQVYNFGDKIPVDTPVHQQQQVIQPVVVENE